MTEALSGQKLGNIEFLEIPLDAPIETKLGKAQHKIDQLDLTDGLIIITDMFGSTPSNIAQQFADKYHAPLLSGMNLPMLMRVTNYRDRPLPELLDKAISGGQQGVMLNSREAE